MRCFWSLVFLILFLPALPSLAQDNRQERCAICAVSEGAGPEPVAASLEFEGKTYFFCRQECKDKFQSDPKKGAEEFAAALASQGAGRFGTLPDWEIEDASGHPIKATDWAGKVIVIDLWATWCGPCIKEIPDMIALQKANPDGLRVLGISYDKDAAQHRLFLQEKALNYPSALASQPPVKSFLKQLAKQIGPIKSIPVTLLIDRKGQIVFKQLGPIGPEFQAAVVAALQAQ